MNGRLVFPDLAALIYNPVLIFILIFFHASCLVKICHNFHFEIVINYNQMILLQSNRLKIYVSVMKLKGIGLMNTPSVLEKLKFWTV